MSNSYKVEIVQTERFVVSVIADNEDAAKEKATTEWNSIADAGMHHYYQQGDTETDFGNVFDVTGCDDDDSLSQ